MSIENVTALRVRIANTRAQLQAHAAPVARSRADAAREIDEAIARATADGRQRIGYAVTAGPVSKAFELRDSAPGMVDLWPLLLAVLGPKAVRAALLPYAEQLPPAPDPSEHSARLAELEAELGGLEREEELAIRALEAQGLSVIRRGDADPAVVLADDLSA